MLLFISFDRYLNSSFEKLSNAHKLSYLMVRVL